MSMRSGIFKRSGMASIAAATMLAAQSPAAVTQAADTLRGRESITRLEGLSVAGKIVRDDDGIPHVFAQNERDMLFLQGWAHARDRLFQMDISRRQAEGTLAELLGAGALLSDVQLRTIGIRRSAERSMALLPASLRSTLDAYANGVNAYVARHALPAEYGALELTKFRPWTATDSVSLVKMLAFSTGFELLDLDRSTLLSAYTTAGAAQGFDGAALLLEDMNRFATFDPAATIPDALAATPPRTPRRLTTDAFRANDTGEAWSAQTLDAGVLEMGRRHVEHVKSLPWVATAMRTADGERGSNQFVIAGKLSATGKPILGSDPHLSLTTPATAYENHLRAPGFDVIGATLPGLPYVLLGHNDRIAWSLTTSFTDVTDVYQERVVPDPVSASGLSTLYQGRLEPVVALPQTFRVNTPADGVADSVTAVAPSATIPAVVLIVPRRNHGPLIVANVAAGFGLSVQYTGSSGTREMQGLRALGRARDLNDFKSAVLKFDTASQNFNYADIDGNIAWFTSGELPLREDLQAGAVAGLPPYFIRNGQGGNEWLPAVTQDADRALPYEILPFAEMPQLVNPAGGSIVNANNDPTGNLADNDVLDERRPGGGIQYLGSTFINGIRAARIRELIDETRAAKGRLSPFDAQRIQADTVMRDARYFTPFIVRAFANAQRADAAPELAALARDSRVQEAVARLSAWDQSTPTGIVEGFDAADRNGARSEPGEAEIAHSVAASIYSVWRNRFVAAAYDAPVRARGLPIISSRGDAIAGLKNLLENFGARQGRGASGIDFFAVPGVAAAADRRDVVLLRSLQSALTAMASPAFDAAFQGSTRQRDYRWGKLHRVVLTHPIGGSFNTPPAGGTFAQPLPGLPGIPTDGGLFTVDVAGGALRNDSSNGFLFDAGPVRRTVSSVQTIGRGIEGVSSLPGGESGEIGSPFHLNLLGRWLTNDVFPLRQDILDLPGHIAEVDVFAPAK
jgi:penicillin G amidase